jgi:Zn-finger protein
MIIKYDCTYFPGDRPCHFHKTEGVKCDTCTHYAVAEKRILIIKLDATGDVLRTTSVLHGIKERYPSSEITWITRNAAVPIFKHNALVNRTFAYESTETSALIAVEQFDLVYNFDASFSSAILASQAKGTAKFGYGVNERGDVHPVNARGGRMVRDGCIR